MRDNPTALAHGFRFYQMCECANPGEVWRKGHVKLTLHTKQPTFLLKRPGNTNESGRIEDLERILTNFGL